LLWIRSISWRSLRVEQNTCSSGARISFSVVIGALPLSAFIVSNKPLNSVSSTVALGYFIDPAKRCKPERILGFEACAVGYNLRWLLRAIACGRIGRLYSPCGRQRCNGFSLDRQCCRSRARDRHRPRRRQTEFRMTDSLPLHGNHETKSNRGGSSLSL